MTTREYPADRGRRLAAEGRVHLLEITDERIEAIVNGTVSHRHVRWIDRAGWTCTCPSRRRCSHVHAVIAATGHHDSRQPAPNPPGEGESGSPRPPGPDCPAVVRSLPTVFSTTLRA